MIDLRRSGRFPKALRSRTREDRLSSGHDDEQASWFRERKPMLEMRSRPQRPILIVGVGTLQRRTGMNGECAESRLLQRRRDVPRQLLHVSSMQITEIHGDYVFQVIASSNSLSNGLENEPHRPGSWPGPTNAQTNPRPA